MSSLENEFNAYTSMGPLTPEQAYNGLMFDAESRYMQALSKQQMTDSAIWLRNGRLESPEGSFDEQVMWYRLAEGVEITSTTDQFDVGIVVDDPDEVSPQPLFNNEPDRHFYVRRSTKKGHHIKVVYNGNALEALNEARPLFKHSSLKGLSRKLQTYHLHYMRVWDESSDVSSDIVA